MIEQDIYIEAMNRQDPGERRRFIDERCGDDQALRQRLEKLIQHSEQVGEFLEAPPEPFEATEDLFVAEAQGAQIGPYKIREQIGEGGMGAVYVAEQIEPVRRKVALKIIRPGMATRDVVARFEAERQALALMDHPNIAKVLDAGSTETGRPYFVMELVRGIPITKYCNQESLSIRSRIELFIKVCHAIQHAHQKGIIHRDIKPSNILVTLHDGLPVPRVIDFGIAKATQQPLTEKTIYTLFQQFIGTPAYMSPEQAELSGLDIDTRSDIYSLGVLGYELLTGVTPFDAEDLMRSGVDAMRKTIREKEPLRPSSRLTREMETAGGGSARHPTLRIPNPAIDRDLDWIVMKCLEKDRTRRYETASGLAMDLTHHLRDEPIVARPPSATYRFQMAFRRNRLVFSLVAAMAATLLIGTGVSTWQALEARRAHQEAEGARLGERQQRLDAEAAQGLAEAERSRATTQARNASESERQARRLLYAADINLVGQALEVNNLGKARRLLDEHRPGPGEEDLRGWEWRYLWKLTRSSALATLTSRSVRGKSVSFSPDGSLLAAGWSDGRVDLWDVAGRRLVRTLTSREPSHEGIVAFSPVRNLLAATSEPSVVTLYDLDSGQESILFRAPAAAASSVRDLAFSKDGSRVVIRARSDLTGYEVLVVPVSSAGAEIESRHPTVADASQLLRTARLSPDNGRLYLGRSGPLGLNTDLNHHYSIQCIDVATGDEIWRTERQPDSLLSALDISPDGRLLASGSAFEDRAIRVWDATTGRLLARLDGHSGYVADLAFTRDGRSLVSAAADQTIRIWDTNTWTETSVLRGHTDEVLAIAVSEPEQLIASTGRDRSLMLWKGDARETPKGPIRLSENLGLDDVRALDHSRLLLLPPGRRPELVDLEHDALPVPMPEVKSSRHVLGWFGSWCGSDIVCHWDGEKQILVHELLDGRFVPSGTIALHSATRPTGLTYNARQQLVAWTEEPFPMSVYVASLAAPGRQIELKSDVPRFYPWRFSEDGRFLVGPANSQQASRAWNVETGQIVASDNERGWDGAFAAGGRMLVVPIEVGPDHEVRFFDLVNSDDPARRVAGKDSPRMLAVSPDGGLVASATLRGLVLLFDPVQGALSATLDGHMHAAYSVAFSPDGKRLISAAGGREAVKIWDVSTHQELMTLGGAGSALYVSRWVADGNVILVGAPFQAWRAPSWEDIEAAERTHAKRSTQTE